MKFFSYNHIFRDILKKLRILTRSRHFCLKSHKVTKNNKNPRWQLSGATYDSGSCADVPDTFNFQQLGVGTSFLSIILFEI
jgi:hypothetical protein